MWSDAVISHTRHIAASLAFLLIHLEISVYAKIKLLFTRLLLLGSTGQIFRIGTVRDAEGL